MFITTIGWLGATLLGFCGAPQAYLSYKQKHSDGISSAFLTMWAGGEILTLAYLLPKGIWPVIANIAINLIVLLIIIWYKINPYLDP